MRCGRSAHANKMNLEIYSPGTFHRGRSAITEAAWIVLRTFIFSQLIPSSSIRVFGLRLFGAHIGRGVVIKPNVKVKFPWRLIIGDFVWVGEDVWIDNLDWVRVGNHSCISQGAYLCTGSHDWKKQSFDLVTRPINIGSHSWIAAKVCVGPGVTIGDGAVVCFGSVVDKDVEPWMVATTRVEVVTKARHK